MYRFKYATKSKKDLDEDGNPKKDICVTIVNAILIIFFAFLVVDDYIGSASNGVAYLYQTAFG